MPSSDAILIGEDWISEHFFTTDATSQSFHARVLARRKEWDTAETPTARSRFTEARGDLEKALAELSSPNGTADTASHVEDARAVYDRLREVLGYDDAGYHTHRTGPVLHVSAPGITAGPPLVLIEAIPVAAIDDLLEKDAPTLLEPYHPDESTTLTSVPRLLSFLFVAEDGPDFALVLAGRWLLVAEKVRWAEGRYLALDLQLVCERNETKRGGETDRALTCIAADSLAPDADGAIWWAQTLEESVKHTVGVSQDLREGVRLSIEIIANEVVTRRREEGLPALPADQAQPLAKQALRFLYRILFLLYAEASPELAVLPVGASEYAQGYSLDRLRELTLVELTGPHARTGTHLYDSLALLFRLVDAGHTPRVHGDGDTQGLTFQPLRADLFRPAATALIDEVGLGNVALQRVLRHLLLSKETGGKDRGFISYAELGINQLGAVYEGLMSYTGFFATDDLYEVAKNGDSTKGSWVVPVDRATGISPSDFVTTTDEYTGERKPVLHEAGTFVFRLAGRERQQSASYYTPEVLTRFTVSQALEELLDQDGTTKAEDILHLTVCEPALGSGAFAIEAVRQLAEQYLRRRQDELGQRIDPDAYPRELQRVKAYLALHQVYGVDLNATAVELAEISLWLDTMAADLDAPWFGLHLRRGNSLIGARHATYSRAQVADKSWLTATPTDHPLTELAADLQAGVRTSTTGAIHHFLLPAAGWGSAVEAKEARALAPDATAALKGWSRAAAAKPTATQLKTLLELADRVEVLWQFALRRLQIAEYEARRDLPVWGHDPEPSGRAVTREEIEKSLADANGAYQRLRRVMDAWAALWFWPLTETETKPPTLAQWLDALQQLLGRDTTQTKAHGKRSYEGMEQLGAHLDWDALNDAEKLDIGFADAKPVASVLDTHPWLRTCERVATQQGFFHWELDFATVFARGGFDLQLGNPPWVRPRSDVDALLAEGDPWWQLALKPSEEERAAKRAQTLLLPGIRELVLDGTTDVAVIAEYANHATNYPHLSGLQPDLYRCFMSQTWQHLSPHGAVGLIHPEKHFTDEKAGAFRMATYARIRRHWHFVNELRFFEIEHHKHYGIHIYGPPGSVRFQQASYMYHPDTVHRSLHHDGSGPEPGLKDLDGHWDERPHAGRIVEVTGETVRTWHSVLEDDEVPILHARMLYSINRAVARVLAKLAEAERIGSLGLEFSRGWDESIDRKKGRFIKQWGVAESWADVILQGVHLFVSTPFYKSPNSTMRNNLDWSETDFESLASDAIPVTAYKPAGDRYAYDCAYTDWGTDAHSLPARDYYRVAWRSMAANTGERTFMPAVIPPGAAHVNGVYCFGGPTLEMHQVVAGSAVMSSLLSDFSVRVVPRSNIIYSTVSRLPVVSSDDGLLYSALLLRSLRLNSLTDAYEDLWREVFDFAFLTDQWVGGQARENRPMLGDVGPEWTALIPLRIAEDRRQAQVEIDALVALMLGVTADELCAVYRTQFAVLYGYDHRSYVYDVNGRLVPTSVLQVWRRKGDGMSVEERTATNQAGNTYTYELPFRLLDREADMRQAYAHFERILAEREGTA